MAIERWLFFRVDLDRTVSILAHIFVQQHDGLGEMTEKFPLSKRIFYAGVIILVAGLIAASCIYAFAMEANTVEFANRQAYEFQIERIGGMATVYMVRFNEWLSSILHGKPLGITVGVLAVVIALMCFWIAAQLKE